MKNLNQIIKLIAITAFVFVMGMACSGGDNTVLPTPQPAMSLSTIDGSTAKGTNNLWGYYDLSFDLENKSVDIVKFRTANYTANVDVLLEAPELQAELTNIEELENSVEVDMYVTVTHPYNLPGFNGYDVRGILIGNGSASLHSNPELTYAVPGTDMFVENSDGYTRWFNTKEFTAKGLFGSNPNSISTPGFEGSATLNPFRYFGEGLDEVAYSFEYLRETGDSTGIFLAGTTNSRLYHISFPKPVSGFTYGFALAADWNGVKPEKHPAHLIESPAISTSINMDVTFDPEIGLTSGYLTADIELFTWGELPSDIVLNVDFAGSYSLLANGQLNPIIIDDHIASYEFTQQFSDIDLLPTDEVWISAEYAGHDYTNVNGIENAAGTDVLTAFDRAPIVYQKDPEVTTYQIPEPGTVGDPAAICVVEDNTYGMAGVYFVAQNFEVWRAPLDQSSPAEFYTAVYGIGNYSHTDIFGQPEDINRLLVNPNGAMMLTTSFDGTFGDGIRCNETVFWYAPNNGACQGYFSLDPMIGEITPIDLVANPAADGSLYAFYTVQSDNQMDELDLEVPMLTVSYPYLANCISFDYNIAPLDESPAGNIDGEVSARDLTSVNIDFNSVYTPDGYDMMVYFAENSDTSMDIEKFAYSSEAFGSFWSFVATDHFFELGPGIIAAAAKGDCLWSWITVGNTVKIYRKKPGEKYKLYTTHTVSRPGWAIDVERVDKIGDNIHITIKYVNFEYREIDMVPVKCD